MFVKRLRKVGKKYAAQYLRVTLLSVVVAAVTTAIISAGGNLRQLAVLPAWLGPSFLRVFVQAFVVCFVIGLVLRLLSARKADIKQAYDERIGGPLVDRWTGLARRTRAVLTGLLTALVVGGVAAAAGVVYTIRPPLIAGVCLLAWPVGTYWSLGRQSTDTSSSVGTSLAVRSRYADLRQQETRTIALLVGFLIGAATGGGLWLLGVDTAPTAVIGGLVWLVATVIAYNRYESKLTERTALAIAATEPTEAGEAVELTIKNEGYETVELTNPTIRDTTHERYRIGRELTLQPGGCTTMRLPSSFTWSSTTAERTLPLGYTLDRSQAAPIIYTRQGEAFELQGDDEAVGSDGWASHEEADTPQSTAVPNGAHGQE
jgi:hypothetical protein